MKLNDFVDGKLVDKSRLKVCLFVASTTGNDEKNTAKFYRLIKQGVEEEHIHVDHGDHHHHHYAQKTALSHVYFSILSLCNPQLQKAPNFIENRLTALGAKMI